MGCDFVDSGCTARIVVDALHCKCSPTFHIELVVLTSCGKCIINVTQAYMDDWTLPPDDMIP